MKSKIQLLLMMIAVSGFIACSKHNDDSGNPQSPEPEPEIPTTGTPVETNPPNANYASAFSGQKRVNRVTTNTSYRGTVINSSLNAPWGVTSLPDGRLLITEKAGTMRIATTSGTIGNAITGIPAVNSAGQGGLLGLCIDPQFTSNRMVYWVFSENVTGGTISSVAKGRLSDNETAIENATVIYRANPAANSTAHYGGRILFDQTGNLVVR